MGESFVANSFIENVADDAAGVGLGGIGGAVWGKGDCGGSAGSSGVSGKGGISESLSSIGYWAGHGSVQRAFDEPGFFLDGGAGDYAGGVEGGGAGGVEPVEEFGDGGIDCGNAGAVCGDCNGARGGHAA